MAVAVSTPPSDQPAEITEWATPRRVQQPIETFLQPVELTRGETALPRAFVYCSLGKQPGSAQVERAEWVKNDLNAHIKTALEAEAELAEGREGGRE